MEARDEAVASEGYYQRSRWHTVRKAIIAGKVTADQFPSRYQARPAATLDPIPLRQLARLHQFQDDRSRPR